MPLIYNEALAVEASLACESVPNKPSAGTCGACDGPVDEDQHELELIRLERGALGWRINKCYRSNITAVINDVGHVIGWQAEDGHVRPWNCGIASKWR